MVNHSFPFHNMNTTWRILIIDDDEEDYLIAREMLREARGQKIDAHWAPSYEAGREELNSNHYNAVLVDYDLGLKSGIDLIRETNERGYASPLILFTGRGNYEVDVEAMQAGATLYLTKDEANPLLLERAIRYAIELKHKEQTLRESEARLRESEARERAKAVEMNAILEAVPAIVWVTHDAQAKEVSGNQAAYDFLRVKHGINLSKSAPIGAPRNFKVYQEGKELAPEELPLQISAATGIPILNFEEEVVFDDGDRAHLLGNVTPFLDEDGKPCGAVAAFIDITQQKNILNENREQRDLLERLVQSLPVGVAFLRGPEHVYTLINNEYLKYARGKGELIGHTVAEKWPDIAAIVIPQMDHVYQTGETFMQMDAPLTIVRDGVPEENFFSYTFTPIYKADGSIEGEMILAIDTTQVVLDRQAKAAQSARLEAVLQALPVGVWIMDAEGQIIGKNEHADRIWAGDAPLLKSVAQYQEYLAWDVDTGKQLEPQEYPVARVLRTEQQVEPKELRIQRFDGSDGYVLVSATPIKGEDGQITGVVAINLDITERKRVEDAMRMSEERLRNILESTHDLFFLLGHDWRIQYVNQRFAETYKHFSDNFVGKLIWEVFPRYKESSLEQNYRKVMEERVPVHFELESAYTDAWYEISAYPMQDGICVFIHDRTEEKRAREALRESRERLERAQRIAHLGSWELDLINNRLTWSDEVYRIFGLQPQAFRASYEAFLEHVHPDDRAAVDDAYRRSLLENRNGFEIDHRVVQKLTGEIRFVHEKCEHYRDASGKIIRSVGMVHDITERKQVEQELRTRSEALRKSEEKFSKSFGSSPVPIAISTVAEGRFVEVNDSYTTLFGFSREELLGHTSIELGMFPNPEDRKEIARLIRETGGFRNYEIQLSTKTGEPRYLLFSSESIEIEGRDCMLSLVVDITERVKVEASLKDYMEKLKRSNQDLEQFAFVASHDLQEPLRKIKLFGDAIQHKLAGRLDGEVQDQFDRMLNATHRMQEMITDLLDLSRVNTQGRPFVQVNLEQVAAEAVSDLEVSLLKTGGKVVIEKLPEIEADAMQIHQVFQNVIGNAIKFHIPGVPPLVSVSGKLLKSNTGREQMVEIQVEDNGIGFDEQKFEQIILPFHRLHGRTEFEGTGIGLAIVKKIIDRHHGTITAHSSPGAGATFIITLPLKQE